MGSNTADRLDGWGADQAIKAPCVAATTANITLSAAQTIDGVSVVAEDRVLVKDQTDGTEDGIYVCKTGAWERARDWNGNSDAVNGTIVIVKTGGTTNGNTLWRSSATDDPYVIDTVSPTFVLAEFLVDISGRVTYAFDSSTTTGEDPGDGDFRLNHATIASATVISFSDNTADDGNPDYSPYLVTWDDSTNAALRGTITISELGNPSIFVVFSVNGALTDGTTYVDIPVAYVTGSGSFTAASKYVVSFSRTGNLGASAGVQMKWDVSTDDADQGAGTIWVNNGTIASATVLYLDDVENAAGASINAWVDSFDDATATIAGTLVLTSETTAANFAVFDVTGAVTSASTYSKVAVTYVTGAGSFSADDKISVSFSRSGDNGSINNVVEDLTPQLGGFLDTNSKFISLSEGAAVASVAGDTDVWANFDGNTVHITGTNAITDFGTPKQAGDHLWVIFDDAASVVDSATITVDGNANFQAAAGDFGLVYAITTSTFYFKPFPNSGALFTDVDRTLTAGFGGTDAADGTKSSGTYTPTYSGSNFKTATNGGAHTLAPQSGTGTIIIQYTNNASAGAVTTSGFTIVTGDSLTTTNGDDFMLYSTVVSTFKHLHVVALQ